jgi:hypothetical protein
MIVVGIIGLLFITLGGLGYFACPLFVLATVYTLSAFNGTEISLKNGCIKAYSSSFGIKKGKWIPSLFLTDICVLRLGIAVDEAHSINQPGKQVYEIFLMTPDHRKRFFISVFDRKVDAFSIGKALAKKLKKEFSCYQPKISAATQAMRYKRH